MSNLDASRQVRGRLAPTPSGRLHLGNARSFLLAWLWARAAGGEVVLRVEDIDGPRCTQALRALALADLAWLGLAWEHGPREGDPPGDFDQSLRTGLYRAALERLLAAGMAYPCVCSRRDIEEATRAPHGDEGPVYPGTCRGRFASLEQARREAGVEPSLRFRFEGEEIGFDDCVAGPQRFRPGELGDFVLWRRDGLPSYQLAVTVDDAVMGVTQVLRGRDLLASTARQLALYGALGLAAPRQWAHAPLMTAPDGRRLAKREGDMALSSLRARGVRPGRVNGLCAFSAGLLARPEEISARELAVEFAIGRVGRQDFALRDEHLAWLVS